MYSILLTIIYLAFISLGLPDSLLGSAWSVIHKEFGVPLSFAGIISMIIACGTIISSLFSDRLTKKFKTGLVTAVSVLLTAIALLGFSISNSFLMLCILAIPYGLGAGAVDAALNNFVALHYSSRHMNWLHCFWGVGAATGPVIMSYSLTNGMSWNGGYEIIAVIQIVLTAILFISLPLWKTQKTIKADENILALKISQIIQIRGVKLILAAFFGYCALESTAGLWAASFLVINRGINPETAAKYASYFYMGITVGRFLSGFISDKIGNKNMIRIGIFTILAGIFTILFSQNNVHICLAGLIAVGFGCAPIYPAIIHSTPTNFGKKNSQAIIGVQMACAYTGIVFMPPLFGLIADKINIALFPVFLLILAILILFMTEKLNKKVKLQPILQ